MIALALAAALVAGGDDPPACERLQAWRAGLEASHAKERSTAVARLRRELRPSDVAAALRGLAHWPPTPALHLRAALAELPCLHAALLVAVVEESAAVAEFAVELLVEAARRRGGLAASFRPELAYLRERRLPWSVAGWRAARRGVACAALSWDSVVATFESAGAFVQPVVRWPGILEAGVIAPRARVVSAEAWLEIELRRRGLAAVRMTTATWVVSRDRAAALELAPAQDGGVELARLHEVEARWFAEALRTLGSLDPRAAGRAGGELLLQLGLGCHVEELPEGPIVRGLREALEVAASRHRKRPLDDAAVPPWTEHEDVAVDAADVRAQVESLLAEPDLATRELLQSLADAVAGVVERHPLLPGELAGRLRAGAKGVSESPASALFEEAAAELWLIGGCDRPGRGWIDLPVGR